MRRLATALALLWALATPALAQYREGQPIEYLSYGKWEVGAFVRMTPDGRQAVILQKPSQFYPEGFQRTVALSDIRARGGQPDGDVPADRGSSARSAPAPAAPPRGSVGGAGRAVGAGPMTEEEILSYLRQHIGADGTQWAARDRDRHLLVLAEEVKRRGVRFHYDALSPFANEAMRNGAYSPLTSPLEENYGPPATPAYFLGDWDLWKVGAPTRFERGGAVYERMEHGALSGTLTIRSDGGYAWNGTQVTSGRWRAATRAEMDAVHKGGAGLVLLSAKSEWDWLVVKRATDGQVGDDIALRVPGIREFGSRH